MVSFWRGVVLEDTRSQRRYVSDFDTALEFTWVGETVALNKFNLHSICTSNYPAAEHVDHQFWFNTVRDTYKTYVSAVRPKYEVRVILVGVPVKISFSLKWLKKRSTFWTGRRSTNSLPFCEALLIMLKQVPKIRMAFTSSMGAQSLFPTSSAFLLKRFVATSTSFSPLT